MFEKIKTQLSKISRYLKSENKENSDSENLNTFMRKKQNLVGFILIVVFIIAIIVLHYLANTSKAHNRKITKNTISSNTDSVPDGVLSYDFSSKNSLSALEQQQSQIDQLNASILKLTKNLEDKKTTDGHGKKNISEKSLSLQAKNIIHKDNATPASPFAMQFNSKNDQEPLSYNEITFHYADQIHQINKNYEKNIFDKFQQKNRALSMKNKKTPKTWVPAGTFDRVVLLVGADANASVNGQSNTSPILMRFIDEETLPNGFHSHLKGCFALASIYGDISSERGEARLNKISCTQKDGSILETSVQGFISFAGKEGIRGNPVMRNGKILTMAGISGVLSGFGSALAQGAQTQSISPLGATTTVSPSRVWESGAYTGASTAMGQLASYYIKRADQYHPVIGIGSGTVATVVFQSGFSLVSKASKNNLSLNSDSKNTANFNDSAEIKALLKENQLLTQEKSHQTQNLLNTNTESENGSSPFTNIS